MNLSKILNLILLLCSVSVCTEGIAQPQIKICITGRVVENLKSYGQSFINAAYLARDENKLADKIEIKKYFYNNSPLEPIHAYKQMLNDGCAAIIGFEYLSDLLLVVTEQQNNSDNIPIFTSYASTTDNEQLPKNIFIFMPSYNFQAKKMLRYLQKRFTKIENVLLITEINREEMRKYKDVYSYELKKKKIKHDTFDFLENDNQILDKLNRFLNKNKYKYVFLLSGAIASAKIADAINDNNITFIGTENFGSSVSQTFFMRLNNKIIHSYFLRNLDFLKPNPRLLKFERIYTQKFHEKPTILAAYTYDAMNILLKSYIRMGAVNTHNIYLINYNGVTGAYLKDTKFNRSINSIILSVTKDGYAYEE